MSLYAAILDAGVPASHVDEHSHGWVEVDGLCVATESRHGGAHVSGLDPHGNDWHFDTIEAAAASIARAADRAQIASVTTCPRCGSTVTLTVLATHAPHHRDRYLAVCPLGGASRDEFLRG
ncbi:MAG TPA: hypothetical protein VM367_03545 [Pseudonocardia sp.]|jgi:ribosomal protein S27AE|nr:hypothetical protein [Pseudonocardia sp.]